MLSGDGKTQIYFLLGSALLLTAAVIIIGVIPPAQGYEISIYEPPLHLFWFCAIGSIWLAQLSILLFNQRRSNRGLALILATNLVVLYLPALRGYPIYSRGDSLAHIGIIHDILGGEQINFYPILHVLSGTISEVSGLRPLLMPNTIQPLLLLFFMGLLIVLVRRVATAVELSFILPLVVIPVFSGGSQFFAPYYYAIFISPFVLYAIHRDSLSSRSDWTWFAIAFIVGVALVFGHFLALFFVMELIVIYFIANVISQSLADGTLRIRHSGASTIVNYFSILSIAVAWWVLQFPSNYGRITIVVGELLTGEAPVQRDLESQAGQVSSILTSTEINPLDLLQHVLLNYGQDILIGLLALALLAHYVLNRDIRDLRWWEWFLFLSYGLMVLQSIFLFFETFVVGYGRAIHFARFLGLLIVGTGLYRFIEPRSVSRCQIQLVISVFLLALVTVSLLNIYHAPHTTSFNRQTTSTEISGIMWTDNKVDSEADITAFKLRPYRIQAAVKGKSKQTYPKQGYAAPPHFNYSEGTESDILITNRLGRVFYPKVHSDYPEQWKYTESDFDRVERRYPQIYSNGGVDIYKRSES
jgi:hypothetical protein